MTDSIAPDIMHDILEGVLQLSLLMLLKTLIYEKSYFQLSILNTRIESFCYGPIDTMNKPIKIKETGFLTASDIKQSGIIISIIHLN